MRRLSARRLAFLSLGLVIACGEGKLPQAGLDYGPEDGAAQDGKDDSATNPASMARLGFDVELKTTFTATSRWRAFRVRGTAGQSIDVFADGLRGLDTVAFVYNISATTGRPYGRPIASNDDAADASWTTNEYSSSIVGFTPRYSRDYAVVVTTYQQAGRGSANVLVRRGAEASGSWDERAKAAFLALLARPGTDYTTDAAHTIADTAMPSGARETAWNVLDMGHGVVWRFTVDGKAAYAAMAEQEERFFASLFDAGGRWFAHGYAIATLPPKTVTEPQPALPRDSLLAYGPFPANFFGIASFNWDDADSNDPTICRCGSRGDICTRIDGTEFYGESDCD